MNFSEGQSFFSVLLENGARACAGDQVNHFESLVLVPVRFNCIKLSKPHSPQLFHSSQSSTVLDFMEWHICLLV